jgi:hypothetical protein
MLDGVEVVVLMAPESEAPAEFMFYLPKFEAFCASEDATHTLHNLYTLREAKVRDALQWLRQIFWSREVSKSWPVDCIAVPTTFSLTASGLRSVSRRRSSRRAASA